ncbi:MAG: succinate dehydrogenase, hydrophobic membrane anchor protein [Aestuariivirgaceae bacterium]|jgi:succinate dehydrogenase / fumarate reductase, membrane anchor subunit|nr:succinate dehydrogenase, hydrophobic membrane anchor protein [Aestuariivirgaceae bacterium]
MGSFRTPLARVRGLGSAKSGTGHFWQQRATAIAGVPLVAFLIWLALSVAGADYQAARLTLSHPVVTILLGLTFLVLFKHMRLGMQVIIEDYVHAEGWKTACLLANTVFTYAAVAAAVYALARLSFGAVQ